VPYVTPYVLNTLTIDPTGLPLDVQLDNTSAQVAPRAGAVVLVKFKSESGRFVLIQTKLASGKTLPFGAEVRDEEDRVVGVVGQAGRIMVRVSHESGQLDIRWAEHGTARGCSVPYKLGSQATETRQGPAAITQVEAMCEPSQILGSGA
jgi:outer membrane usher protein